MYYEECITYLLDHMDCYIEDFTYRVLNDSEEDPQYSTVTLFNLVKCYISVSAQRVHMQSYENCEAYWKAKCFSNQEIAKLESKRRVEASYYVGRQF